MSNDRCIDVSTQVESASSGAGRTDRARPAAAAPHANWARPRRIGEAGLTGRPFADATEAMAVGRACRAMLARHIEPDELPDSVALVLAAKILDEVEGDEAFEAARGEPRVSASRFDHLVAAARAAIGDEPVTTLWNGVAVPELVAHQILRDLGPYSVLRTADLPGGRAAVRGLFEGASGDGSTPTSSGPVPAMVAGLQRLAAADRDRRSLAAVAAAAAEVFGPGADGAVPAEVVDLRDREVAGPRHHRRHA